MMAEGESVLVSPTDSSDEALQLDARTDEASVVNASSDSGDYETLIRTGCESSEHLNADISEVTQEASKVLDQFLKLSLGQGCVSSAEGHAWADVEPQYAVLDNIHKDSQPTPYQPMGSDQSLFESLGYSTGDVGKTIYQELTFPGQHRGCAAASGRGSPGAAVRQRSAPGKFCIVADDERTYMPLLIRSSEAGHKYPKETQRKSSSSSVGDYEYSDTVVTNRKRKSLIRLAKERLQRSFRHDKKTKAASAGSLHSVGDHGPTDKDLRKVGEGSPSEKLRLSRAKGVQKTCYSSSSPYEVGDVLASGGMHPQNRAGRVTDADSGARHCLSETGYLTGDTDDASKKYSLSPLASKKRGTKSKSKKNRDIFGGILKQLRKSSQKPQFKAKEGNVSSTITLSPTVIRVSCPTDSEGQLPPRKLPSSKDDVPDSHGHKTSTFNIGRQKDEAAASQFAYGVEVAHFPTPQSPHVLHSGAGAHDGVQQERRSKMQLEGLVPCLPNAAYAWKEAKAAAAVMSEQETGLGPWKGKSLDEIDGGRRDLKAFLLHHSSKPFSQKTEREKDELYEHIAGQLATIAYNYAFDLPHNSSVKPLEASQIAEGAKSAAVCVEQPKTSGLESSAPSSLQATGDRSPYSLIDSTPVVAELVQSTSYSCFEQIISSSIGTSETGWHQIAMMFRLTQSAIVMAGMGTAVALHIKELTLKYFEDRFANWIVTQGGWESMVDETNTELDSELD